MDGESVKNILRNEKYCGDVLMQKTYTVDCLTHKTKKNEVVFPITEVVSQNEFFDYNAKYKGEVTEITPARLSPELTSRVQQLTSAIYDILGCKGIVRVDTSSQKVKKSICSKSILLRE